MAAELTYDELLAETHAIIRATRDAADRARHVALQAAEEAQDTGRIADQIATLHVDPATIASTREVAAILQGLAQASTAYAASVDETLRAARVAEQQTRTDHGGIHEAVQSAPVPMAARGWYTQE